MRLWGVLWLVLAGCVPDIPVQTYFCGSERACPDGQACDEDSLVCVRPNQAQAFTCGDFLEESSDDTFDTATELGTAGCERELLIADRCFQDEGVDYYRFDVADGCEISTVLSIAVAFPFAFVPVTVEVLDDTGAVLGEATDCLGAELFDGRNRRCLDIEIAPQAAYGLRVAMDDVDDCGGSCRYNRYSINARVERP